MLDAQTAPSPPSASAPSTRSSTSPGIPPGAKSASPTWSPPAPTGASPASASGAFPSPSSSAANAASPSTTQPSTRPSSISSEKSPPTPGTSTTPPKHLYPPAPPAPAATPSSARRWTSSTSGSSPAQAGTLSSTRPRTSSTDRPRRPLHRRRRPASRLVPCPRCSPPSACTTARPTAWSPPTAGPSTNRAAPSPNPSATASTPSTSSSSLGGEIIRLWVASVDFREDVVASQPLLQRLGEKLPQAAQHPPLPAQQPLRLRPIHRRSPRLRPSDRFTLPSNRCSRSTNTSSPAPPSSTGKIRPAYDDFEFHRAYHLLNEFVNSDLSALYLDVLKDRLYTFPLNHPGHDISTTLHRPPQRPNRPLPHRRSPRPPHRPHPQLHRRRGLAIPPRQSHGQRPPRPLPRHARHRPRQRSSSYRRDWEYSSHFATRSSRHLEEARTAKEIGNRSRSSGRLSAVHQPDDRSCSPNLSSSKYARSPS